MKNTEPAPEDTARPCREEAGCPLCLLVESEGHYKVLPDASKEIPLSSLFLEGPSPGKPVLMGDCHTQGLWTNSYCSLGKT